MYVTNRLKEKSNLNLLIFQVKWLITYKGKKRRMIYVVTSQPSDNDTVMYINVHEMLVSYYYCIIVNFSLYVC